MIRVIKCIYISCQVFLVRKQLQSDSFFWPDASNKGVTAQGTAVEPTQVSSGPVVLNPMMPYWPVPPPMPGQATGVNVGMDYWGAPTSVPMHGKAVAAPTSAPSSNSRDIVLSDPVIQVCYYLGFCSPGYFIPGPCRVLFS